MPYYDVANLVTVTKTNMINEMPGSYATLRTTSMSIRNQVSCRPAQRSIFADLDWTPSALRNALQIWLSNAMKDSFTYSDMPEELPAFVTVCQQRDNQIR